MQTPVAAELGRIRLRLVRKEGKLTKLTLSNTVTYETNSTDKKRKRIFGWTKAYFTDTDQSYCKYY
jgi:hypothetical protein